MDFQQIPHEVLYKMDFQKIPQAGKALGKMDFQSIHQKVWIKWISKRYLKKRWIKWISKDTSKSKWVGGAVVSSPDLFCLS